MQSVTLTGSCRPPVSFLVYVCVRFCVSGQHWYVRLYLCVFFVVWKCVFEDNKRFVKLLALLKTGLLFSP